MQGALAGDKDGPVLAGGCREAMREFDPAFYGSVLVGSDPAERVRKAGGPSDETDQRCPATLLQRAILLQVSHGVACIPPAATRALALPLLTLDFLQVTPLPLAILLQGIPHKVTRMIYIIHALVAWRLTGS